MDYVATFGIGVIIGALGWHHREAIIKWIGSFFGGKPS